MNYIEFNIRLYFTGTMKSWTDRIDCTEQAQHAREVD
jgi:hypothetical protein